MAVAGKNNIGLPAIFDGIDLKLMDDIQKKCYLHILNGSSSSMSNEEFDSIVLNKVEGMNLKERSMQVLNIDSDEIKEIDNIYIANYAGYDKDDGDKFLFLGRDGKIRSRFYDITYIYFGEYQLYIYYCRIDTLTDDKLETTSEFFYKDITNIEKIINVKQWSSKMRSGCLNRETNVKQIGVYRGFTIFVSNSFYSKYTVFQPGIDESIDGMIAKIRDKKNR